MPFPIAASHPRSRRVGLLIAGLAFLLGGAAWWGAEAQAPKGPAPRKSGGDGLVKPGRTEPAPGRVASVCPRVLQPVSEVLVAVGDRVEKGAVVIRHDDDDAKSKVKAQKAALAEAQATLGQVKEQPRTEKQNAAREVLEKARIGTRAKAKELERAGTLFKKGAIAERQYQDIESDYKKAQAQEREAEQKLEALLNEPVVRKVDEAQVKANAAKIALRSAERDLEDLALKTPLGGVVSRLKATPGLLERPGTAVWAEVIDLSELDVRCPLTPAEARSVRVGQSATVADDAVTLPGRVVAVIPIADRQTGHLPVLVRVANPDGRLPCYVPVQVTFGAAPAAAAKK